MKKEPAFMAGSYVNECFQLCMLLFSFVAFTHQGPLVCIHHKNCDFFEVYTHQGMLFLTS